MTERPLSRVELRTLALVEAEPHATYADVLEDLGGGQADVQRRLRRLALLGYLVLHGRDLPWRGRTFTRTALPSPAPPAAPTLPEAGASFRRVTDHLALRRTVQAVRGGFVDVEQVVEGVGRPLRRERVVLPLATFRAWLRTAEPCP